MNYDRFRQILDTSLIELKDGLTQKLPDSAFRDFCLWTLAQETQHRDTWVQGIGAVQIALLTQGLFDAIVSDDQDWQQLATHCAPLCTYLVFEAMSDDLAIGLASQSPDDTTFNQRHELVYSFNQAMIERLTSHVESSANLLAPIYPLAQDISSFDQKLAPAKHRTMADAFLLERPDLSRQDLEFAVWPCLQMNMEMCHNLVQKTKGYQASSLLREGLLNRYKGVNSVLKNQSQPLHQQADIGAYTILVIPTLAYYVIAWAEMIHPMDLTPLLDGGTLSSALYDAALLSRLLNDLGCLAVQSADERNDFMAALRDQAQKSRAITIHELLESELDRFGPLLARIHKDIAHREFNMSLNGLSGDIPIMSALATFEQRVTEFSELYQTCNSRLMDSLDLISDALADEAVSHLIGGFVQFHQTLYSNPHTELSGEYTV